MLPTCLKEMGRNTLGTSLLSTYMVVLRPSPESGLARPKIQPKAMDARKIQYHFRYTIISNDTHNVVRKARSSFARKVVKFDIHIGIASGSAQEACFL